MRSAASLELCSPDAEGGYRVKVDLTQGAVARRVLTARRTDALPRAVGLTNRLTPPTVVDATAGLGRDALVLAHLGCTVTALERVPALAFLLHNAIEQCRMPGLEIIAADAIDWLRDLPSAAAPDVVYLDPMFLTAGKAQVKKEMQACRALAGEPEDPAELLAAARQAARERVVVKRHPHHAAIAAGVSHQVLGERVRFDVYLRH